MSKKNTPIKYEHIYFNPKELWAIATALGLALDTLKDCDNEDWNDEAKKTRQDIKLHCIKAAQKIERITGVKSELPEYNPGDEKEFLN